MKNSNPVSPVILEGAPAEITISNASAVTQLLNPEVSNYSVTTSGNGNKTITLVRPVSNEATRRLIAKNGCMITFFGKSISGGTVTINFESGAYEDITVASTPVTSHTLIQNEYITFVFVRDTWRLMNEISPASLSSVPSLTISGTAANSLNFSGVDGGITFSSSTTGNVITGGGNIIVTGLIGATSITGGRVSATTKGIKTAGPLVEKIETSDIYDNSALSTDIALTGAQFNMKTRILHFIPSGGSRTVTLPVADDVISNSGLILSDLEVGDSFYFTVINAAGANTVSIAATNLGVNGYGNKTIAVNTAAEFAYRFTNVTTGSVAAELHRIS